MKLNRKGFTLIELLAVITILGILMIVGIPAVQRTINNSRKDTFLDTAKEYANAVKTAWAADEFTCTGNVKPSGADASVDYIVYFATTSSAVNSATPVTGATTNKDRLLQSGGKSSWGNNDIYGYVKVDVGEGTANNKYYVYMMDSKGHGIDITDTTLTSDQLERAQIKDSGASLPDVADTDVPCNVDA